MTSGIYMITNNLNNKQYIGQSIHIEKRIKEHIHNGRNGITAIGQSINKYGWSNFSWEILCECKPEELDAEEIKFISLYNTYHEGYNLTKGGEFSGHFNPMFDPEIAKRNAESRRGKKTSKEFKLKIAKTKTSTGVYRVVLEKCKKCKSGFIYRYEYYNENKDKKYIRSTDIRKLKKKIINQELEWTIIDEEIYNKQIQLCKENVKQIIKEHTTGIFRVIKHTDKSMSKGYIYRYTYYINGVPHYMENSSLDKLKERVLAKGLEWLELRDVSQLKD